MNKMVIFVISMFFAGSCFADALKSEVEVRSFSDKVMAKVATGDLTSAFNLMKPYVVISATEVDSVALQSRAQREQYGVRYGKSIGYEYIGKIKRGESLMLLQYIEKTTKHAIPWSFYFYKTNEGWVLNTFDWNDLYQPLFNLDYQR